MRTCSQLSAATATLKSVCPHRGSTPVQISHDIHGHVPFFGPIWLHFNKHCRFYCHECPHHTTIFKGTHPPTHQCSLLCVPKLRNMMHIFIFKYIMIGTISYFDPLSVPVPATHTPFGPLTCPISDGIQVCTGSIMSILKYDQKDYKFSYTMTCLLDIPRIQLQ